MGKWKCVIENIGIASIKAFAILMVMLLASDTTFYWYKQEKWFLLFGVIGYLFYKLLSSCQYKVTKSIVIISLGISASTLIGISIRNYANFDFILNNLFLSIVLFYGYYSIYVVLLIILKKAYFFVDSIKNIQIEIFEKNWRLIAFCVLFVCYGLFATITYPIQMAGDSPDQVMQALGQSWLCAQHPIAHTKLIGLCLLIGYKINGTYNLGAYIYSIIQVIILSFSISMSYRFYKKWNVSAIVQMLTFIYYLVIPSFWTYSNFMMKDTIYFSFFIMYLLAYIDICKYGAEDILDNVLLASSSVGMVLFRKNGLYIVVIADLFLFILVAKFSKKILLCIVVSLIMITLWNSYIYKVLNVGKGYINEAMSVPFQQTAFYISLYDDEISQEEKDAINGILSYNGVLESYQPGCSDNVKRWFVYSSTKKDLIEYMKIYFKFFFRHPKAYVLAATNMFSGWFDIDYKYGAITIYKDCEPFDELDQYSIHFEYPANIMMIKECIVCFFDEMKEFPATTLLFSAATYIWMFLCVFIVGSVHKLKIMVQGSIPNLLNLGICLLAPLTGEMRYAMPIVATVPIMIALLFCEGKCEYAV